MTAIPDLPSSVAEIVAVPTSWAVASPLLETLTIAGLSELHRKGRLSGTGLSCSSTAVATSCTDSPMARESPGGVTRIRLNGNRLKLGESGRVSSGWAEPEGSWLHASERSASDTTRRRRSGADIIIHGKGQD